MRYASATVARNIYPPPLSRKRQRTHEEPVNVKESCDVVNGRQERVGKRQSADPSRTGLKCYVASHHIRSKTHAC